MIKHNVTKLMIKWYGRGLKVGSSMNFQIRRKYKAEQIKIFIISVMY